MRTRRGRGGAGAGGDRVRLAPRGRGPGGDPDGARRRPRRRTTRRRTAPSSAFPTTLAARLPARAAGSLTIEVRATDKAGAMVASGHAGPLVVVAGQRQTSSVKLECDGLPCVNPRHPRPGRRRPDASLRQRAHRHGRGVRHRDPAGRSGRLPPQRLRRSRPLHHRRSRRGRLQRRVRPRPEIVAPHRGGRLLSRRAPPTPTTPTAPPTAATAIVDPGETCDTGHRWRRVRAPARRSPTAPTAIAAPRICSASAGTCAAICVHYPVVPAQRRSGKRLLSPGRQPRRRHRLPGRLRQRHRGEVPETLRRRQSCRPRRAAARPSATTATPRNHRLSPRAAAARPSASRVPIEAPVSGDGCCFPGATHSHRQRLRRPCATESSSPARPASREAIGDAQLPDELLAALLGLLAREPGRHGR